MPSKTPASGAGTSDADTLEKEKQGQSRRLRKLKGIKGIDLYLARPGKNVPEKIEDNSIMIVDLNDTKSAKLKIEFKRPDLVSLSDQSKAD